MDNSKRRYLAAMRGYRRFVYLPMSNKPQAQNTEKLLQHYLANKFHAGIASGETSIVPMEGRGAGVFGIRKANPFSVVKASDKDYVIDFLITTPDVDRCGDSVDPMGVDVSRYLENPRVFFNHKTGDLPIASTVRTSLAVTKKGIYAGAKFIPSFQYSLDVYNLIKSGDLEAASIGFIPLSWEYVDDPDAEDETHEYNGVTITVHPQYCNFTKTELLEWSVVGLPANPFALVRQSMEYFDQKMFAAVSKGLISQEGDGLIKRLGLIAPVTVLPVSSAPVAAPVAEPVAAPVTEKSIEEQFAELEKSFIQLSSQLSKVHTMEDILTKGGAKHSAATIEAIKAIHKDIEEGHTILKKGMKDCTKLFGAAKDKLKEFLPADDQPATSQGEGDDVEDTSNQQLTGKDIADLMVIIKAQADVITKLQTRMEEIANAPEVAKQKAEAEEKAAKEKADLEQMVAEMSVGL